MESACGPRPVDLVGISTVDSRCIVSFRKRTRHSAEATPCVDEDGFSEERHEEACCAEVGL
jgi:hypothetical protein